MVYEGMETVVCDAEENDWLDVAYSERKYVKKPEKARKKTQIKWKFNKKIAIIAAVAVLCLAAFATLLFIDGNFTSDVFGAVKTVYSSTVFANKTPEPTTAKLNIPCNVNLVEISKDGVATFNGGRAVVSFSSGKVVEASETSVTVAMDDNTCIVYDNLVEVYASVGDVVAANGLLGKYDGEFSAVISVSGEIIKQVVGSPSQLTWNV